MPGSTLLRLLIPVAIEVMSGPVTAFCAGDDESCKPKTDPESDAPKPKKCKKKSDEEANQTELEKCVAKCRKDIVPVKNALMEYSGQAVAFARDSAQTVKRNVNYLQNCAPTDVKVGTIIGSGLFGMLLGFRRGLIRKLFYGAIGSTTAAVIIYPREAKVVASTGCALTRAYAILAYKYVTGTGAPKCKKECKKEIAKKAAAEKGDCCCPTPKDN